jgi:hypothetical protein
MKRGDDVLVQAVNLTCAFWKDSGLVCFLSSIVDPTAAYVTVNRRNFNPLRPVGHRPRRTELEHEAPSKGEEKHYQHLSLGRDNRR